MPAIQWLKNRGRNGWNSALQVPSDQSVESRNVHFYDDGLGKKRGGSTSITITGVTAPISAMFEYVPGQDLTAAELFVVESSATTKILRCAAGSSFSNLTLVDNVATSIYDVFAVVLNGKLYLAYDSTVNRIHVFDPGLSTTKVRRAGMGTPAAPTGADDGAGGLSLTRSYKVAFTEQRSSVTVRRSELSPVLTRTIAAKLGSTITKPASLSEDETHWELYASDTATGTYYLIATTAVGTTTYDDTASTIDTTTAAATVGTYTPFPSVKYPGTDGNRLYGLGVWESTAGDSMSPKNGRFFFGPVIDSSGTAIHDDERINNTTTLIGYIDLSRNAGAIDRGVSQKPINNVIYAFQSSAIYALVPTENATTPYRRVSVTQSIGAVNQQSIVIADEKDGAASVYFLDPTKGPYTVGGQYGLKWCGKDVKDIWDTVKKDAATLTACGCWYPDRNIILWSIATGSSDTPNLGIGLDVTEMYVDDEGDLRGGWFTWDGDFASARSIVMFSNTLAATRSRSRVPYVGTSSKLLRYDESVTSDDSVAFQAYITSGALAQETKQITVSRAYLRAGASSGVTIRQSFVRNFGDETNRTSTVLLTAAGSETKVLRKFEDAALADGNAVQVTLGDASAVASAWSLESWEAEAKTGAAL